MSALKGRPKPVGAGRASGTQNKATIEFKEAVNNLISFATPQMVEWLGTVASEDPNKALDHVFKFAQFGYPLLARTTLAGDENAPPVKTHLTIEFVGND